MERIFAVTPAHDCLRSPCRFGSEECSARARGASHGIGSATLYMTVRDVEAEAEVTLDVGTGWYLPETPEAVRLGIRSGAVTIHTTFPRYEGDWPSGSTCELWTPCYVDTGFTIADTPTALLVSEGSDAAWGWLENFLTSEILPAKIETSR